MNEGEENGRTEQERQVHDCVHVYSPFDLDDLLLVESLGYLLSILPS